MRVVSKRTTVWLVTAAVMAAMAGGCARDQGSKEYIPGKGWRNAALTSDALAAAEAQPRR